MTQSASGTQLSPNQGADATQPSAEVRASIRRDVAAPLAVLRAAMEALAVDLPQGAGPGDVLEGALEQVVRLGQSVQGLVDYAMPPALHPLSCSAEELLRSTSGQLESQVAEQLTLASEDGTRRAHLDGAVLSRRLAHLATAHLEPGGEGLLRCRVEADELVLTLCLGESEGSGATPPGDDLSALLAQREVERMGGIFSAAREAGAWTTYSARFACEEETCS